VTTADPGRVTIGAVLRRNREFRALAIANALSLAGDDLARVALAIVFFQRTHSPFIATFTFALSFLPGLFGGPLLATLGDRFPRRHVMVVCDVARTCLVGFGAVGLAADWSAAVPLGALLVAAFFAPPFEASRAALMPEVVRGADYVAASTATAIASQMSQIVSYVVGAAAVATVGGDGALLIDAWTFAISAIVLMWFVRTGAPADRDDPAVHRGMVAMMMSGARDILSRPALRSLLTVGSVTLAATAVAEGLAVVYAAQHGLSGTGQGLIVAAIPIGATLGGFVLTRLVVPLRQPSLIRPLAVGVCLPLIATALPVGPPVVFALWVLVGLLLCFQYVANAAFVLHTPDHLRARAMGLAQGLITFVQAAAMLLGGAAATRIDVRYVVAGGGLLALVVMARPLLRWPVGISVVHDDDGPPATAADALPATGLL
jgi:MFS family permease